VKDLVAHLLDTCYRRLSFGRDGMDSTPDRPIASYQDLVDYLNQLNADWVKAMRRMSPSVLMELLDRGELELHHYFASLDPEAPARFGVAWAGEEHSLNWFDLGREYTERWIHQQQIREAVGASLLSDRAWLHPALDIFVRVLPFTYRTVPADPGATLRLEISGPAGGVWTLARGEESWALFTGSPTEPSTGVDLDQETAWKLFSKGLSPETARQRVHVEGDPQLADPVYGVVAVMA